MKLPFYIRQYLLFLPAMALFSALNLSCWSEFDDAYNERWDRMEKIVFSSNRDGNYEIYIMNPDGTQQTRLTFTSSNNQHPTFSPDGSRIAFQTDRDGNWEIYTMKTDGSDLTRISNHTAPDIEPCWSYDGRKIAFNTNRQGEQGQTSIYTEVYIMNPDGSSQTNVTHPGDPFGETDQFPAWSPDGATIVFARMLGTDYVIKTLNLADLTVQDTIISSSGIDRYPAWSPDGSHIAFMSNRDGNQEIYVLNITTTIQTRLSYSTANDTLPCWSPDGARIVFTSMRDGNEQIYVMNADGSGQTRLTNNTAVDTEPCWGLLSCFQY